MSTSVSPAWTANPTLSRSNAQASGAGGAAHPTMTGDRVATTPAPVAPLLTIGAAALVQLVPGVVEAEGAAAIATTIGIGVRAAMANPVVSVGLGIAGTEALGYAKSLAHDAFIGQPGSKVLGDLGTSLDSSLRAGLGIAQSGDR